MKVRCGERIGNGFTLPWRSGWGRGRGRIECISLCCLVYYMVKSNHVTHRHIICLWSYQTKGIIPNPTNQQLHCPDSWYQVFLDRCSVGNGLMWDHYIIHSTIVHLLHAILLYASSCAAALRCSSFELFYWVSIVIERAIIGTKFISELVRGREETCQTVPIWFPSSNAFSG